MFWRKQKKEPQKDISGRFELIDSLRAQVDENGLDGYLVSVGTEVDDAGKEILIHARSPIFLFDGEKIGEWEVDSLRSLFRGDEPAPSVSTLSSYPAEFTPLFYEIERDLTLFVPGSGLPPTDAEFLEVFSALRRRPDGRSIGKLHDFVWMHVALMLGKFRCSESLYTAIMKRLEHSARTFKMGPSSRNYMDYIGSHL